MVEVLERQGLEEPDRVSSLTTGGQALDDQLLEQFCQKIRSRYGHRFDEYNLTSLKRRIRLSMVQLGHECFTKFSEQVLDEVDTFDAFVQKLSVNVTSMFRDPDVFKILRKNVLPKLASFPHIRIWCAGVSTGEEAYSLAILLQEEGLYHRSLIYATDMNPYAIKRAYLGRYSLTKMMQYSRNYSESGGLSSLSRYYKTTPSMAYMRPELLNNVVFSTHNLTTDGIFNEFHLVLCRNVLIYFNEDLVERTLRMINQSLVSSGFLCLGAQESLFREQRRYHTVFPDQRVFRKI